MKEYPNYYSVTPATVRYDKRLKPYERLLFGEITALSNIKGYCYSTNKYFANLYQVTVPTISKWINHLKGLGYLRVEMIKDGKEIKERHLYPIVGPINQKVNTPINQNVKGGINRNVKENNTSINNINTNKLGCYAINFYENNIGMLSPWIREDIEDEVKEWNKINADEAEKIIVEALKNAVGAQARNKWKYAKSILSSWKERNIKSLSDIKADDKQHQREVQIRYSHKNYGRKPVEEQIPDWNMQTPKPQTKQSTADIKELMAKVNRKTAANKD